jgi:hypothetical protein
MNAVLLTDCNKLKPRTAWPAELQQIVARDFNARARAAWDAQFFRLIWLTLPLPL